MPSCPLPVSFAVLVALLGLSACESPIQSEWVPSGYKHQGHDKPLSNPAPTSPWMDDAVIHDTDSIASNTAAWQGSVFELIGGIDLPADETPLALKAVAPVTAQDRALDHYLRQALFQKGKTLTETLGMGLTLSYDAVPLASGDALAKAKAETGFEPVVGDDLQEMFLLSLDAIGTDGKPAGHSSVVAVLPHEKTEYLTRLPGFSAVPARGRAQNTPPVYETRE
jgi:hypothetical protein